MLCLGGLVATAAACSLPVDANPSRPVIAGATADGGGGTGGGGYDARAPEAGDGGAGCPDVPQGVIAARCATSACHSAADKAQGLDLESPDLAARLVGVAVTSASGLLLIDPAAPRNSALYTKLTDTPPYGARMPLARTALDDATIACLLAWVAQSSAAGADAAN